MSILKALPSRRNPQAIQQYLLQEKKLRNSFISGSQVRARNFGKQFDQVQQLYGKTTGRRYYHYILSFSPEETQQLSPREVNQMGVELAEEFFGKKGFQFAVVTHTDTDHLHDHIVVNAVNLESGKKLHTSRQDLKQMKSRVNELCQSRGLQPIPQRNEGITNGEYWAAARGQDVWKEELREAIDCVRQKAKSYDDFKATLENEWGVTVTRDHGRGMTYTHPTNGKKVRGQKLGPAYDKPSLMKAFTTEKEAAYHARNQDDYEERHRKKDKLERVEEEIYIGWSLLRSNQQMALTNTNGLTPGQVTLQKEILDRFGALEAQNTELKTQNAALENHVAELKEALQKFQKESDASQTHTLEELQADIHRTDAKVVSFGQEIRD
ncbi:relaxase/mobilization nuclease domain-containing protein [Megasphaera sp.]|uniref:relaxase/mobilization nuclease domain-containing protein n=1 Tax=Megasphaera sp. TaxID=2023260 RepID=UPI00402A025A